MVKYKDMEYIDLRKVERGPQEDKHAGGTAQEIGKNGKRNREINR